MSQPQNITHLCCLLSSPKVCCIADGPSEAAGYLQKPCYCWVGVFPKAFLKQVNIKQLLFVPSYLL